MKDKQEGEGRGGEGSLQRGGVWEDRRAGKKTQKSLRSEAVAQVRNTEAPGAALKASDQTLLGFSRELGQ